jgi:hypothetical protein
MTAADAHNWAQTGAKSRPLLADSRQRLVNMYVARANHLKCWMSALTEMRSAQRAAIAENQQHLTTIENQIDLATCEMELISSRDPRCA